VVDPRPNIVTRRRPDPGPALHAAGQILPPKCASGVGAEGRKKRPVGAGLRFVSWRKDGRSRSKRWPTAWQTEDREGGVQAGAGGREPCRRREGRRRRLMSAVTPVDFAGIQKGERTSGIGCSHAFLANWTADLRRSRTAHSGAQLPWTRTRWKNTLNGYGRVLMTSVISEAFGHGQTSSRANTIRRGRRNFWPRRAANGIDVASTPPSAATRKTRRCGGGRRASRRSGSRLIGQPARFARSPSPIGVHDGKILAALRPHSMRAPCQII
jgi:hypothetical protein